MASGANYEHFIKPVKINPNFPDNYNFVLVNSIDKLKEVLSNDSEYVAWDLETSSLSPEEGKIVGVAVGFDTKTGYYIPIAHAVGENIEDPKLALDLFYERLKKAKKTFVYNMRFDYRFMEFVGFDETKEYKFLDRYGYDMSVIPYYDVSVGVWLSDTNVSFPSLKWAAKHFLGWDMQTFEETLGDNSNFEFVDPKDAATYAGADALSTYTLAGVTIKYFKEARLAGKLDNKVLYPLMKFEDHPLEIDVSYLEKLLMVAMERHKELEQDIYSMVGYQFNIRSGPQLSESLEKLGLHTGEYTKSGYMSTSKKLIAKLNHPVAEKLIEYKELGKAINSYIEPLAKQAKKKNNKLRFAYHTNRVPTGRLACGGDKKNDFFAQINLQSIPKPSPQMWYVHKADDMHSDSDDNIIMGYRFSMEEESDVWIEGSSPDLNVRKAFLPDSDEYYWVSIDFSSQELRIPTNLTKEPVWLDAFLNGRDPHKSTAIALFGEENYDGDKRKKAKGLNFGLLYGMSPYSVQSRFNMDSYEEAEEFVNHFKNTLNTLFSWVDRHQKKVRKKGVAYTYFGRPRRLKYYFSHPDSGKRAFAYRSAVNTCVQGAGSDILKIALIKLWENVFTKPEYNKDCIFLSTIHDEINFAVRKTRMKEIVPLIKKCMELEIPGWPVPMAAGLEIGNSWGHCFEFDINDKGDFVPAFEPVEGKDED